MPEWVIYLSDIVGVGFISGDLLFPKERWVNWQQALSGFFAKRGALTGAAIVVVIVAAIMATTLPEDIENNGVLAALLVSGVLFLGASLGVSLVFFVPSVYARIFGGEVDRGVLWLATGLVAGFIAMVLIWPVLRFWPDAPGIVISFLVGFAFGSGAAGTSIVLSELLFAGLAKFENVFGVLGVTVIVLARVEPIWTQSGFGDRVRSLGLVL